MLADEEKLYQSYLLEQIKAVLVGQSSGSATGEATTAKQLTGLANFQTLLPVGNQHGEIEPNFAKLM